MIPVALVVLPLTVLYLIYKYLIYPAFLSPLSKIPNAHFTSSFSPLWILLKRYQEQENRAIHSAHLKHGDVVRLGSNEVSVSCVDDGIRTIYSGGFEKWSWYPNQFCNYGYDSPWLSLLTQSILLSVKGYQTCSPWLRPSLILSVNEWSPTSIQNPTCNHPPNCTKSQKSYFTIVCFHYWKKPLQETNQLKYWS